jgi:hypothetical protein
MSVFGLLRAFIYEVYKSIIGMVIVHSFIMVICAPFMSDINDVFLKWCSLLPGIAFDMIICAVCAKIFVYVYEITVGG